MIRKSQLKRDLANAQERLEKAKGHLEIAESIAREVSNYASQFGENPDISTGSDFEQVYVEILALVTAQEKQKRMQQLFDQLPAESRMNFLLEHFGQNDADLQVVNEAMERQKQREIEQTSKDKLSKSVLLEARKAGWIDLAQLPVGTKVDIDLFDDDDLDEDEYGYFDEDYIARRINGIIHNEQGDVRVLRDAYAPNDSATSYDSYDFERTRMQAHSVVRIGADVGAGDGRKFMTQIYRSSELHVMQYPNATDDLRISHLGLIVGDLTVDNYNVF